MHTIHLNVHDSVYDHFMKFLGKFKNHEIDIVSTDIVERTPNFKFEQISAELHAELNEMDSGKAVFFSQEEFEKRLNECI